MKTQGILAWTNWQETREEFLGSICPYCGSVIPYTIFFNRGDPSWYFCWWWCWKCGRYSKVSGGQIEQRQEGRTIVYQETKDGGQFVIRTDGSIIHISSAVIRESDGIRERCRNVSTAVWEDQNRRNRRYTRSWTDAIEEMREEERQARVCQRQEEAKEKGPE
jgi:hypothetical protein